MTTLRYPGQLGEINFLFYNFIQTMNVTKSQKLILTIYAGSAYSTFRDNDLLKLKNKAKKKVKIHDMLTINYQKFK